MRRAARWCDRQSPSGTPLLLLEGERCTNGWLLAGPGWIPPPRVDPAQANAEWRVSYCTACNKHVARLTALTHLDAETEVVCPSLPAPDLDTIMWPYEVTFDGGARYIDGDRKVAGAAATLWHYPSHGGPLFTSHPSSSRSLTWMMRRWRKPQGVDRPLRPLPMLRLRFGLLEWWEITWRLCDTAPGPDGSNGHYFKHKWSSPWARWRSGGGLCNGRLFGGASTRRQIVLRRWGSFGLHVCADSMSGKSQVMLYGTRNPRLRPSLLPISLMPPPPLCSLPLCNMSLNI